MISILVYILVLCLVFGVCLYVVRTIPLPAPFGMVAQAIVALVFLLVLLDIFFGGGRLLPVWRGPQ